MNKKPTEKDILERLANPKSQREAFVSLMELYREPLYWHIRRLVASHEDAQDALQECFIKVHKYIGEFRQDSSLKTWLYHIATNEAIRLYRRSKLDVRSYDEHDSLMRGCESDSEVDYSSAEAKLQRAINSLPHKQRVVFNLRYYDEMTYEQIAEVTESSVSTLKTNYHYAMGKIKEYMLNNIED